MAPTLLIVEDDPHYAQIIADLAHDKGLKVLVAMRGADALALAREYQPMAVSLDVFLPDMLGWTVLSQLKQNPATRHIPVQVVTLDEDRQHGLARGAFSFVNKPSTTNELDAALTRITEFVKPRRKRLLIVEDNPDEQFSIKELLGHDDIDLVAVGTGSTALTALRADPPDCVVLDLRLPDMSGFDLLEEIRDDPALADLPVVVFTGHELSPEEDAQLHTMARSVVVKGVESPERLLDETALFLHRVVANLPDDKQRMLERLHNSDEDLVGKTVLLVDDDARELYRKTRQLETLNAELERRVAARTAELAQTNADLERRVEERTREREMALAQVHEMQKVESLGQVTGGVAHDFNNLLMAVLGNLEILRKCIPDNPRLHRLIDGAIQGAERGATLTRRMLAFARRQELRPETVAVPRLVDSMVEMLRSSLGPGVQIVTQFDADLPATRVDPNQLELALLNLALNARDAMPRGGMLTISAHRAPVGAGDVPGLKAGEYVCIAERDTGTGMDETTVKRAMEPFFTTKGAGRGTGLGLSMVDGLVAQSGGAMRITSKLGTGTTIELWLPVSEPEETEEAGPPGPPPLRIDNLRSCRVLLVDDDPIVAAGTAAMLEDLGHRAIEASSAEIALQVLSSDAGVDFVITDHAMPGMTGTELAERIRRRWPRLPVVHWQAGTRRSSAMNWACWACRACRSRIARRNWPGCWPVWSASNRLPFPAASYRPHPTVRREKGCRRRCGHSGGHERLASHAYASELIVKPVPTLERGSGTPPSRGFISFPLKALVRRLASRRRQSPQMLDTSRRLTKAPDGFVYSRSDEGPPLANNALDNIDNFARPERLHQGFVGISPAARHLKQIAAHYNGLRSKMRGGICYGHAIAVRQLPVDDNQCVLTGVKVCPSFCTRRRQVHEIPLIDEHVRQEHTGIVIFDH